MGGEGLKWGLNFAAFAGMVALSVILFNVGGAGGLIGGAIGFVLRLGGRGLDMSERLGNAYAGALMGLPIGLLGGALYHYIWPQIDAAIQSTR
ncbi:hypothetical protein U91I_00128 [alpha proteobacterium U9-1i]|nr:hypothetical protein U91I_00128 [alpha proteobacterium U9-1i]